MVALTIHFAPAVTSQNQNVNNQTIQPTTTPSAIVTISPTSPAPTQAIFGNFTLVEIKEPKPKGTEYVFVWHGPTSVLTIYKDKAVIVQSIEDGNKLSITFKSTLKIENWPHLLIDIQL